MNNNNLPIKFIKNMYKETAVYPKTMYLEWAPFADDMEGPRDVETEFHKKDPLTYIKHKDKDLWLYDIEGKLKWAPLHCDKKGFTFKQPQPFWVEYLKEPTFFLYKIIGFGKTKKKYLSYKETDKGFQLVWKDYIYDARIFSFEPGWNQGYLKERYSNQALAESVRYKYGWIDKDKKQTTQKQ